LEEIQERSEIGDNYKAAQELCKTYLGGDTHEEVQESIGVIEGSNLYDDNEHAEFYQSGNHQGGYGEFNI